MAVDAAGKISICNAGTEELTTYNANGTPASLSISGLSNPNGVAVDGAGNIYIANDSGSGSVTTYNSSGTAGPTITTGLASPDALAVH